MNEMKLVSDACGADWDSAVDGFIRDGRIGHSHLMFQGMMANWVLVEYVFLRILWQ